MTFSGGQPHNYLMRPPSAAADLFALCLPTQELPHVFNTERGDAAVQDRMAVRADRTKIRNRVHDVLTADLGQRAKMVDVDVTLGDLPVHRPETEPADAAACAVYLDALPTGFQVALVGVYQHPANGSRDERGGCRRDLLGKQESRTLDPP